MSGVSRILSLPLLLGLTLTSLGRAQTAGTGSSFTIPRIEIPRHVMLGIDVLEAEGFAPLRGKRLGLLTQRAGVDSRGVSTVDILRGAPGLHLVALFATENGISGEVPSGKIYDDRIDPRTGLMVYSLYNGRTHQPTAKQLKGIDALVVDLQDIGTRSYTFTGAMKQAMEGCFANNVEIIVLDRPNPLGGLKVDGPMLDPLWIGPSLVNEFPVPYVHGLTIGELARLAKGQPGILRDKAGRVMPDAVRLNGRLTVVGMRGWRRNMRWSETGLRWIPTSPFIPDFSAVVGYPMTGLGCIMGEPGNIGGFTHGVGADYPFRGIGNKYVRSEVLEKELDALHLPGLQFRRVSVPSAKTGKPSTGLYIEVTDWDAWRPTELNFYLMKLDCKYSPHNPFAAASPASVSHFLKEMGSMAFYRLLVAHGANVDVDTTFRQWEAQAKTFQDQSRRYWLYN
jgi:uncharacterized protein YbbC (DUF1343 family)